MFLPSWPEPEAPELLSFHLLVLLWWSMPGRRRAKEILLAPWDRGIVLNLRMVLLLQSELFLFILGPLLVAWF
jgi:hypothetical protein